MSGLRSFNSHNVSGTERPAGLISRKCAAKEGPRLTDSNGSSSAIGRVSIGEAFTD